MPVMLDTYRNQLSTWPQRGRHILAHYDTASVIVYQAFSHSIGRYAATHGRFGFGFGLDRMSWIKPNFLWMMYRSGWGMKEGQEVVLAVWLTRAAFDTMLAQAVHTTFVPAIYGSEQAWQMAHNQAEVLVQWDPDHDPTGAAVERRALQLGLRGDVLARYAHDWIRHIEDVSALVAQQRLFTVPATWDQLLTPRETVYPVTDDALARQLGLSPYQEQG